MTPAQRAVTRRGIVVGSAHGGGSRYLTDPVRRAAQRTIRSALSRNEATDAPV
jgi:hypothetical protein